MTFDDDRCFCDPWGFALCGDCQETLAADEEHPSVAAEAPGLPLPGATLREAFDLGGAA